MKTLKLFNAVLAQPSQEKPFISEKGFIITPNALWAKDRIIKYYSEQLLSGKDLNKTFHKSWKKIKDSSRAELLVHQIMHYLTTYGSNFQAEIYIPQEVLKIPDTKLVYKVILAYSEEEMRSKCLNILRSGIALDGETVDDILSVLTDELNYTFTGKEGIKNKEALVKIAEDYGIYPDDPVEFLRYIIYRTTDLPLLIKNQAMIATIKRSSYNPSAAFKKYGLIRLAEIFNRFKPLFLAYKGKCPKTINKISKLSKAHHKPLTQNALNLVTSRLLTRDDTPWLENATLFALFKALSACYSRARGQNTFAYRIRNGKSWVALGEPEKEVCELNLEKITLFMCEKYSLEGKKIFLPKNVSYALPTSEKMFVGNIPSGTEFTAKKMAVGIYWENEWGARDLDLSGVNINGKIGWNAAYKTPTASLMFSGDITNAPSGAVEYLYAKENLAPPTMVLNNVYSGREDAGYKIIIGKGDKISKNYMMNPNNLFVDVKTSCVQTQMILGIFLQKEDKQSFTLLNFGAGSMHVGAYSNISRLYIEALVQQYIDPPSLEMAIKTLRGEIVDKREEADYDFSLDVLQKDSFTQIFQ